MSKNESPSTKESSPKFSSAIIAPRDNVEKVILPQTVDKRDAVGVFYPRLPSLARSTSEHSDQTLSAHNHAPLGGKKKSAESLSLDRNSSGAPVLKGSLRTVLLAQTWSVSDDYRALPEIPMYYPIETTSTTVKCRAPRELADRVVGCLRRLSVAAEFNPAEASLLAETVDHIIFYVRLYKKRVNGLDVVLVEIQRSLGNSFIYSKYARAILASARGEDIDDSDSTTMSFSLPSIPDSIRCEAEVDERLRRQADDDATRALEDVEVLLQTDRLDAALLGMDCLLLLFTDSGGSMSSHLAAEAVLLGEETGSSTIKEVVTSHVCCIPPERMTRAGSGEIESNFESRQRKLMHNLALAVLGNSLQTLVRRDARSSELRAAVRSDEWLGPAGIASVLLSELSRAHDRTHDAYQAARCINAVLEEGSSDARNALVELGLQEVACASQAVGRSEHYLLERECDLAILALTGW